MSVKQSAQNALKILLDEAEARKEPAPGEVVAELEWIIAQFNDDEGEDKCANWTQNYCGAAQAEKRAQ